MNEKILVVDDDQNLLKSIKKILRLENYEVDALINGQQVDHYLQKESYHCLLLDVKMPVISGMDILKDVLKKYPVLPVIMISGQSDIDTAVEAIKKGAYDFIEKPIDPERLFVSVKNALNKYRLQSSRDSFFEELQDKFRMIGKSKALTKILEQIHDIADQPAKVLILGESGTGKELVAWAIHHGSSRRGKPYLKVNCAAIPSELLESELFGHRKGSFTGAVSDRKGKFTEADGGTLLLDEIGNMDMHLQAKLLRVLEESEVEVIGENQPKKIDVRIIAATNQNLEKLIEDGKFREDLYYRLNVVKICIPPLRKRPDDILPLAYHFLEVYNNSYNKQVLTIRQQAESVLLNYDWPGNVRQLRNTIEKLVLFSHSNEIDYPQTIHALELGHTIDPADTEVGEKDDTSLKTAIQDYEKKYILMNLQKHDGKIGETARALGIDRSNLFKKMRKYGLHQ
jgi:DNA-binding NtrC family response regulator